MLRVMLVKEFILVLRDKYSVAALFIMPAIFILIMSVALDDTFESDRALLNYIVVDNDDTVAARGIVDFLSGETLLKSVRMEIIDDAHRQELLNENVAFVLVIPEGFSRLLANESYEGALTELYVAADVKQEMLTLFTAQLAMAVVEQRLEVLREEIEAFFPPAVERIDAMRFDMDDVATVRYNAMETDQRPTSTQQSVPSWIVFAMFFVIIPMSTVFITERNQNTLMRMRAMNVTVPVLFAGKIAPYFVINQIQVWVMIAVGVFVVPLFGADPLTLGRSVFGLFLVSFGLSVAAIGTTVLISVSVGTVTQATTIGGIINILLGAVGGIMVPRFLMPPAMQSFSYVSPMSWGLEGFLDIFLRNLGPAAVVPEFTALAAFGVGLLLVAGMVFTYKLER